ncbi:M57 family metalloprotease [Aquimarina sp. 2201CG5-10]|uniref:M57 family metalloprotease n=1 Tax=Aquimarina callyspongiae TaxID=3098150 RepID=UPI002AB50BE8|nr:M57 family metalloprotease [Aquimarina sp. 2201CG5-10]MDY8135205.1 M57 family metalloprotease [Aquimarina sp. 2201CG5-10]
MKKIIEKLIVLFVLTFLIQSCSKDDSLIEMQNNSALKAIESLNFPEDLIIDKGSYYLVDGDLVFFKDQEYSILDDPNSKDINKQRRHYTRVRMYDINVFINPDMNADWRDASQAAINRWNAATTTPLNLIVTTDPSDAHIQIIYDSMDSAVNLGTNVFGQGEFPIGNGLPGRTVWINPDFDSNRFCGHAITQNMRIANVQHELGHNLGLTHTNQSFGVKIPGTPDSDPQSVMNGGEACTINDFSLADDRAIRYLFPALNLSPEFLYLSPAFNSFTGSMTVEGFGPVTVTLGGAPGVFISGGSSGGSMTNTLNLTAPATFQVHAPDITRPGYGVRESIVLLQVNNTTVDFGIVIHSGN